MVMPGAGADKRPLQVVFTAPQRKMILKHLWWFDWGVDQYQRLNDFIACRGLQISKLTFPTCALIQTLLTKNKVTPPA